MPGDSRADAQGLCHPRQTGAGAGVRAAGHGPRAGEGQRLGGGLPAITTDGPQGQGEATHQPLSTESSSSLGAHGLSAM